MATKFGVIQQLGGTDLLRGDLVNAGLAANDRLKYYLTLLQAAKAYALEPGGAASNLRVEREASGVADARLDDLVLASARTDDGRLRIPSVGAVLDRIVEDLGVMLRPLDHLADDERRDGYRERLAHLRRHLPDARDDLIAADAIDVLTRIADEGDTVHRLVMDLHRELNALQASIASEPVDGAKTYDLGEGDDSLVRAFMLGLNETAPLKFDHPGLGTTATRTGSRLSIQNDLGTTESHVIVINIIGRTVTLIYTDIHSRRARFLHDLLEPWHVAWQLGAKPSGAAYEMHVGTFTADDDERVRQYLSFLGSRLVFLIDWNKARKRLSRFVRRSDAIAILRWAADNNIGHRGFLVAGDAALVYTALERTASPQLRYGTRLDELLGREAAREFLIAVLRITFEGLRQNRSRRLIQDEIHAQLLGYLHSSDGDTLAIAAEHAALLTTLADRLGHVLMRVRTRRSVQQAERAAQLAKRWQRKADELVARAARLRDRTPATAALVTVLSEVDSAADSLEEAAFWLTLVPEHADPDGVERLESLADLVSQSARQYARAIECARDYLRDAGPADLENVLVSVDRVIELEHEADAAERDAQVRLIHAASDFRELHVVSEIADSLEGAADGLARGARLLRDHVLRGATERP